jgi:hypothetical protein
MEGALRSPACAGFACGRSDNSSKRCPAVRHGHPAADDLLVIA